MSQPVSVPLAAARPRKISASAVARHAMHALVEEATLTPKPALVDVRGHGAHRDLSLSLMLHSAQVLEPYFTQMAEMARCHAPDFQLREELGVIGREAECAMMRTTNGINTHRGAIWALGLLVAGAAQSETPNENEICHRAAALAAIPDSACPAYVSNGLNVRMKYGANGARAEAIAGFPHIMNKGLPALRAVLKEGRSETDARLSALLTIMTTLEDTCLLHRGGLAALEAAQRGAAQALACGGYSTMEGKAAMQQLHESLMTLWASPGGSADMLAATLFVDRIHFALERAQ